MITYNDVIAVADRQSKTYATNQALCEALGVDVQSFLDSPLLHYPGIDDLMSGVCIGLALGKDLYRENQDHAPTENHDEFLESLPEADIGEGGDPAEERAEAESHGGSC